MGLLDLFRRQNATGRAASVAVPGSWVPAGGQFTIGSRVVPGGMVYVGSRLRAANGYTDEPALINPGLPVDWNHPDMTADGLGYWPSYIGLSPQRRAGYITWLADGRSARRAPIGYVFLFFYGLERRLFVDLSHNVDTADAAALVAEVRRLRSLYGSHSSFDRYSGGFLDVVGSLQSLAADVPPTPEGVAESRGWDVPLSIRVALGRYAAENRPIPDAWALALLRMHPEVSLRTAAVRCAPEFDELFRDRYRSRFGAGIVVRPPAARVTVSYHAASAGLGPIEVTLPGIPDITGLRGPLNKLTNLAEECTAALDAYSRFLGRTPDGRGTPAAVALLPPELLASHGGAVVDTLRSWADGLLTASPHAVVACRQLVEKWDSQRPAKLGKADAVALAGLLAKLAVAMEPDVRFGGATPRPDTPVVLFRLPSGAGAAPSSAYAAAAVLVHLAAVVSIADGSVTDAERRHMVNHVEDVLALDAAERARLDAHLSWLVTCGDTGLGGLKRRVETLSSEQRTAIARFLVGVAAADGQVSPAEITILTKVYKLLGLDESAVFSDVHAFDADAPPMVAAPDTDVPRWRIPSPESDGVADGLRLDPAKVQARLAETAEVTALLADIFSADEAAAAPSSVIQGPAGDASGLALDAAHGSLARALLERPGWERAEAEAVATQFGFPFLDSAVDRINEAVIERCGEPLVEGDDFLDINDYASQECFA